MKLQITWPMAFVLVLGVFPFAMFLVAVCAVYPFVGVPIIVAAVLAHGAIRKQRRTDALALRAEAQYPTLAAVVAAPLPDMPTVPNRQARWPDTSHVNGKGVRHG